MGRGGYHRQPDTDAHNAHKPQEEIVSEQGRVTAEETLAAATCTVVSLNPVARRTCLRGEKQDTA